MEILGWLAIVIIGTIAAFFLLFLILFFILRRNLRGLGAALEAAAGGDLPHFRIQLVPLTPFEWHDEAASERAVTQLAAARFAEAGRFTLDENPSARSSASSTKTSRCSRSSTSSARRIPTSISSAATTTAAA